jgi:hypothetical protein
MMQPITRLTLPSVLLSLALGVYAAAAELPPKDVADCYVPVEGGWRIRITADANAPRLKPGKTIGAVGHNPAADWCKGGLRDYNCGPGPWDDPRTHRRPLYCPADRSLVWTKEELAKRERVSFRPKIICANAPRFLVDMESAGGHSGHLLLGLSLDNGPSKWLHQFSELDVQYVDGRMEYAVRDAAFPGVTVRTTVLPLAESVGLVMKLQIDGLSQPADLVWVFGGATSFEHYKFTDGPAFWYAPEQCDLNVVRWENGRFALSRKDATHVVGGSSWTGQLGFADPKAVMRSPAAVCESATWCAADKAQQAENRVAVQKIHVDKRSAKGRIVIGRGGQIESFLADPNAAEEAARTRSRSMARRVVVHSPDPYLNQSLPMIALVTDGTWGDTAVIHGGWSWHQAYLGWRTHYGLVCYGWTDRARHSLLQHCRLGLIRGGDDAGGVSSMLEAPGSLGYNMDEVFTDHVRQYFDYTGDMEFLREVYPVLEGVAQWETRRLQVGKTPLYESALDTWISDHHWYIRAQCTTASSYMLGLHRFLAEAARALGKDPEPYRRKAEAIRSAMQQKLWQPRRGVFAECQDTLGAKMLHPEPELPTIYHSSEFGAADPLQIYQMVHWADHNLPISVTPYGGKGVWNCTWAPNNGRNYTHSTYELAFEEQFNLAVADYVAGRADEAYALLRGGLCGIYNGPTPGGLGCDMCVDGRQRRNAEFADATSMFARAVIEGMYGIRPKRHRGTVELSPQFPTGWRETSIETPHFSYKWKTDDDHITIEWSSPVEAAVVLRHPLRAAKVDGVTCDGKPLDYHLEPGVGLTWLSAATPSARRGLIAISYVPSKRGILPRSTPADVVSSQVQQDATSLLMRQDAASTWTEGENVTLKLADYSASDVYDPQGILSGATRKDGQLQGTVAGEPGARVLFLKSGTAACPLWLPLTAHITPKQPVAKKVWTPPVAKAGDLDAWTLVDLSKTLNASVPEVLERVSRGSHRPPMPASQVNYSYWRSHVDGGDGPAHSVDVIPPNPVSDAAWRKKISPDGIAWTHDGIPVKSPKEGRNIAVVTRAGGFPQKIEIPVDAAGKELYLMISGMTFPAQSHVVNLQVVLDYADGTQQRLDLVNPFDIGDCWSTWCGRWHDTAANGFENLGGRFGPPGSAGVDLTRPVAVDNQAHLVKIPLRPRIQLRGLTVEAVANDVIFGLMGVSILK